MKVEKEAHNKPNEIRERNKQKTKKIEDKKFHVQCDMTNTLE